jgi:hypothetical protein
MVTRQQFRSVLFLAVLVITTFVIRQVLTGGLVTIRLQPAPPLAGVVAQNLRAPGTNSSLLVPGKDFRLENIRYFDNRSWAVASVVPISIKTDTATVVLHQIDSEYQVVLGPGTSFSTDYLQSMPLDVGQYLINQKVLYDSGN